METTLWRDWDSLWQNLTLATWDEEGVPVLLVDVPAGCPATAGLAPGAAAGASFSPRTWVEAGADAGAAAGVSFTLGVSEAEL